MVLDRFFGKKQKYRFECIYGECNSLCCKNNLVALNKDDIAVLGSQGIDIEAATIRLSLNKFLQLLGTSSMKPLEGLSVLQLKKDEEGNCVFLETAGSCKIYEVRPYYCREFPFKFAKGKIKSTNPVCPGVGRGDEKNLNEIKNVLGIDEKELKPPYLVGDEDKIKTARVLMSAVFRFMK